MDDEQRLALALAALGEVTDPANVGELLGAAAPAPGVVDLRFATTQPGYPGWSWTVSTSAVEGVPPTVLEIELLPGDAALLAPPWVPWAERLAEWRRVHPKGEGGGPDADDLDDDGPDDELEPEDDDDLDDTEQDDDLDDDEDDLDDGEDEDDLDDGEDDEDEDRLDDEEDLDEDDDFDQDDLDGEFDPDDESDDGLEGTEVELDAVVDGAEIRAGAGDPQAPPSS